MFQYAGWHGALLFASVAVWLIVVAGVFFALYWVIRLAVTHALRAAGRGGHDPRAHGYPTHPSPSPSPGSPGAGPDGTSPAGPAAPPDGDVPR
jgi:hypothetical protein